MINNSKLFLDANVLLEIILDRPFNKQCRELLRNFNGTLHISALSAHLVMHFGLLIVDLKTIKAFLDDYIIESLESVDFDWAYNNCRGKDFEDALQLAVAIRSGADDFITLDKALVKIYKDLPTINIKLLKSI